MFDNYKRVSDWLVLDVPRCDWHADAMSYNAEERRRLAEAVRQARITAQLDKEPAARAAKVSSITWKRVEDADGVRDAPLSKILESLGLPTADEILREPFDSGPVVIKPTPARIVLLSQVPTLDLLDEVRRRVVSPDETEVGLGRLRRAAKGVAVEDAHQGNNEGA